MALLKDQKFYELCQALQCTGQTPSDPDRKAIEKAFRKLALKTHPDKVISKNYFVQDRSYLRFDKHWKYLLEVYYIIWLKESKMFLTKVIKDFCAVLHIIVLVSA